MEITAINRRHPQGLSSTLFDELLLFIVACCLLGMDLLVVATEELLTCLALLAWEDVGLDVDVETPSCSQSSFNMERFSLYFFDLKSYSISNVSIIIVASQAFSTTGLTKISRCTRAFVALSLP